MANRDVNITSPIQGMNTDNNPSNLDPSKAYTFALNARIEGEDGNAFNLTNEESNTLDIDFKDFVLIGKKNITEINRTIIFLVNDSTSIIGYIDDTDVTRDNFEEVNGLYQSVNPSKDYTTIVNSSKLNFSKNHPIHKIAYKINKDKVEIYWTDDYNAPRYLDLSNIPYLPNLELDINKCSIFPDFNIPEVSGINIEHTGSLKAGSYQIFLAYSNSKGEEISQYYSSTNPIPIHENLYTINSNYTTSQSINIQIQNVDTNFKWLNIAIAETIDNVTNYYVVATLDITSNSLNYLFTGQSQKLKDLSISDILYKSLGVKKADIIESQNSYLMMGNLEVSPVINCQSIASKLTPKWISYRIPYNSSEGYSNGINSEKYRGFMRDEVYPLEFVPIFKGGIYGNSFHIPGRKYDLSDLSMINNKDTASNITNKCDIPETVQPAWKVYNTATSYGVSKEFTDSDNKSCYIGPYETGDFAYWESTEKYPDNVELFGNLSGQYIRHHKFPDELVSARYSVDDNGNEYIYPLGVYIDPNNVFSAIQDSDLTQEEKDSIIGFKIIRGNRSNNASIIAKGLVNNVGKYTDGDTSQEYYFANYPYNDVRPDPYFATKKPAPNMGLQYGIALDGFGKGNSKNNFIFYSPDTSFNSLPVVPGLQFKLEDIEYGISKGHFVQELNNARHKFISHNALKTSILIGVNMGIDYSKKGLPSFNGGDAVAMIASMKNLFENLLPYQNFGYSFHSVGTYNNKYNIPNSGNKLRSITYGKHVTDGLNGVSGDINLNHLNRESGVFISTNDDIPFTHEYDPSIPNDISRYIPQTFISSQINNDLTDEEFFNLCKTDQTALVYGTLGVINSLSTDYGGESNLMVELSMLSSATFSDIVQNQSYQDILKYKDFEDLVIGGPVINDYYNIAWPGTNWNLTTQSNGNGLGWSESHDLSNVDSPYKPWIQNSSAYKADGSDLNIASVSEVVGIPPIGKVRPTDTFLFYYVSDGLYPTRDDIEGQHIMTYWPPDNPKPWDQGGFEWGPNFYLSEPYNYRGYTGDIIAANTELNNGNIVHEYHGYATSGQGSKWPWGAGTLSADSKYFKYRMGSFFSTKNILWGKYLNLIYKGLLIGKQAYLSYLSGVGDLKVSDLGTIRNSDISSYYVSVKRSVPNQWGSLFSFERVDTGHEQMLFDQSGEKVTSFKPVFGGDTFITKFALKIKNSIYTQNIVGYPDGTEIAYNKLGNYGYPMFWISSEPLSYEYHLNSGMLSKGFAGIGLVNKNLLIGNALSALALGILNFGSLAVLYFAATGPIAAVAELIVVVVSAAIYVIGWIFTNKGNQINKATFSVFRDLLQQMLDNLGVKNLNLDFENSEVKDKNSVIGYTGAHYLFSYGISSFFVESDINTEYRQAENTTDKNYYPNVGNSIPDQWLMETNVPIKTDNYYMYNPVYSKQNLSNLYRPLPRDYSKNKKYNIFPTRVIYSNQTNQEEIEDNWKIFKANNYFDFPLTNGKLIDLNALEENKVLVRFENNSYIYNAYTKLQTSDKTAIIGTGDMFANPPQEFSNTDNGYIGTQSKAFISSKYGYFSVDAKRGEIFHINTGNQGIEEISRNGMKNWFKENLPFKSSKYFKDLYIDNPYTSVGVSMGWDNRFERLFITKKDYQCIDDTVKLIDNKFYKGENEIFLTDDRYFKDCSWTISYNPSAKSWVSYHSFIPDYYIEQSGYFQTGKDNKLWSHGLTNKSYQIYYNNLYSFEIECITKPQIGQSVLQSVQYRQDTMLYKNLYDFSIRRNISFDRAEIYSTEQASGVLDLTMNSDKELYTNITPIINTDNISISLSNKDDIYKFNTFYNIVKDIDEDFYSTDTAGVLKELIPDNIDYSIANDIFKAERLRSDYFKVKLKNTKEFKYKFLFKWLLDKSIASIR